MSFWLELLFLIAYSLFAGFFLVSSILDIVFHFSNKLREKFEEAVIYDVSSVIHILIAACIIVGALMFFFLLLLITL